MNPRSSLLLLGVATLLGGVASPAAASVMIRRDMAALARDADVVARGTVTDLATELSGDGRRIFTVVTLQVAEAWKGKPAEQVRIRVHGGTHGDIGQLVQGEARFHEGEEVVVFLRRHGSSTEYRVAGMAQGKLTVAVDPDRGEVALPDLTGLELVEKPGDVPVKPPAPQPVQVPVLRDQVKAATLP